MRASRRAVGELGERIAASHLEASGYRILAANWRCRMGEIDLVAQDGSCLVIAEVRTKTGPQFGSPEESIGYRKQAKLRALAEQYVQTIGWRGEWRIDVVAVELAADGSVRRLDHYRSAIGGG